MTSAFGETLKSITTTKLKELSKKRQAFEANKLIILKTLENISDRRQRLRHLLNGVKKTYALKTVSKKRRYNDDSPYELVPSGSDHELVVMINSIERFLEQAQHDPTISEKSLIDWEHSLLKKLDIQSLKYEYASTYGELVNDWLISEHISKDVSSMDVDSFEVVDKAEKQEARKQWESAVFEPFEVDQAAINSYLQELFGKTSSKRALIALRKSVETFEGELSAADQFNEDVLRSTIHGLLNSGLLSEEKNQVLKDFLQNPVILAEVADVLNMRIVAIEDWNWEQDYIPVDQRRHLNGNYHIYIDEDLIEAIFLQYVGIKWSVFFKKAFASFFDVDGAWASPRKPISKTELQRRQELLGTQSKRPSVQSKRQGIYKSLYFMSQLPDSLYEALASAEGEEEADYDDRPSTTVRAKQTARKAWKAAPNTAASGQQMMMQQAAMPRQASSYNSFQSNMLPPRRPITNLPPVDENTDDCDDDIQPKSPMAAKQFLLHLLSTEILVNTKLHGDFTAIHSSFESWSPTLSHSTIGAVLSFYGLSSKWLGFFSAFLEAPLRFTTDGPAAPTRTRKRGVPGAHSLSSICGEAILFVLDYAVNQTTDGAPLYRMHDDFWLWSPHHDTVVKGWDAIKTFADVMGVRLNDGKTGSVRICPNSSEPTKLHSSLPVGKIRWGFLTLDAFTGRFVIDQHMVDKHIVDLKVQLKDKKSVFSYIQAWNTYAGTFFLSNFASPCNSFGRGHVDSILGTLRKVQDAVFGPGSNVAKHIKEMIESKFGVKNIPDGYLYFPTALGGLELQNPFVGMVQIRNSTIPHPLSLLENYLEDEKEAYKTCKKHWENGMVPSHAQSYQQVPAHKEFLSFAEFIKYREELSSHWPGNLLSVYEELLRQPAVTGLSLKGGSPLTDLVDNCKEMDSPYLEWVGVLYGKEMIEQFGGLRVVEKGLLPVGMVNLFRSGRIQWQ